MLIVPLSCIFRIAMMAVEPEPWPKFRSKSVVTGKPISNESTSSQRNVGGEEHMMRQKKTQTVDDEQLHSVPF